MTDLHPANKFNAAKWTKCNKTILMVRFFFYNLIVICLNHSTFHVKIIIIICQLQYLQKNLLKTADSTCFVIIKNAYVKINSLLIS